MKNKIVIIFLVICTLSVVQLKAQIKQANFFFEQFKYSKAIQLYKKALLGKDEKIREEATVRLADCYRLMNNANEARSWYARAVKFKDAAPLNYYYLGMSLRTLANYDEAEKAFSTYAEKVPSDCRGKIYAQYCRDIKQWNSFTSCAEIKNEQAMNSPYSDFGAVFYKDGLIFTSDRDIDMMDDKNYLWTNFGYLDLYSAQPQYYNDFWSNMGNVTKMPNTFNQPYHDGPASFTADYKQVFITRTLKNSTRKDSANLRTDLLKIYFADLTDEKKIVYKAFPFNSDNYSVGHPSVSVDGKKLIFSSNAPNGEGQSDLYCSELVDGQWSHPVNLGTEVNTFGNEVFPFLANDSTLFFASDGLPGYGGLDIYETNFINGKWSTPINLKAPINSAYDDFSVVFDSKMTDGFFSSNRPGGVGSDDIYAFKNYRQVSSANIIPDPRPLAYAQSPQSVEKYVPVPGNSSSIISGFVKDKRSLAPLDSATVFVLNTYTNEVYILKTDSKGYFEVPVSKGILYVAKAMKPNFFDDGLNFRIATNEPSNKLKTPRDLLLDKYALNQVFVIENIYYDLDKWFIRDDAKPSLDKLVHILKQYPISVELGSHTDSRASVGYNNELSQKRAESVVRYLTMNGINPARLTAKGYGETVPVNKCKDGVPCTEPEYQANRRTEFKITAINTADAGRRTINPSVFMAGDKIPVQLLDPEFFNICLDDKNAATNMALETTPSVSKKTERIVPSTTIQEKKEPTSLLENVAANPEKTDANPTNSSFVSVNQVWFAIQLAASTTPIKIKPENFKGEEAIHERKVGKYRKYIKGRFSDFAQAMEEQRRLLTKFPEAFIVAFKGNRQIPLNEARNLK